MGTQELVDVVALLAILVGMGSSLYIVVWIVAKAIKHAMR